MAGKLEIDLVHESTNEVVNAAWSRVPVVRNLHRILALSPEILSRFIAFSAALRHESKVAAVDKELAVLVVLERHAGEHELPAHRAYALSIGLTEEQVRNVCSPEKANFDTRQLAILRLAERLSADPADRDSLPSDCIDAYLDHREIVEIVMGMVFYLGLAHFAAVIAIPPEP